MDIKQRENETDEQYLVRLVLAKKNGELRMNWNELGALLGYDSSEFIRKIAYGVYMYDDVINSDGYADVDNRILCISDSHVPFHLPTSTFQKYKGSVDTLVLNGDILDMQGISKFPKNYRVSPMEEMTEARDYIIELIEMLKPKKVIGINGNHEIRFGTYLAKNLDSELLELMPNSPLELIMVDGFNWYDKRNFTKTFYSPLTEVFEDIEFVYTDDWKAQVGDIVFCHPLAFSSVQMATAKKAYTWFLENGYDFKNIVVAHTHRVGNYVFAGKNAYESGCCSDIEQNNYTNGKLITTQSCGYMYFEQDKEGNTIYTKQELV